MDVVNLSSHGRTLTARDHRDGRLRISLQKMPQDLLLPGEGDIAIVLDEEQESALLGLLLERLAQRLERRGEARCGGG